MKTVEKYLFKVPAFLLPALINGDESGLNESDTITLQIALDRFKNLLAVDNADSYILNPEETEYFTWTPDFLSVGCNVCDTEVITLKRKN